jgi:hypothetical protein
MYFVVVACLMLAAPLGSIVIERSFVHAAASVMSLIGKWFVFWAVGVRLALAGLRQCFDPRFTAEQIFDIHGDVALPVVRELGFANFAAGMVGILSLLRSDFILPSAIAATLFYGAAGFRHAAELTRNAKETFAMATDLSAFAVLAAYSVYALSP